MKEKDLKPERVALLNAWKSFEQTHGTTEDVDKVEKQMPRKVKKRRKLEDDSFEEYVDYVFPADDESAAKLSNLLAKAREWKAKQQVQQQQQQQTVEQVERQVEEAEQVVDHENGGDRVGGDGSPRT